MWEEQRQFMDNACFKLAFYVTYMSYYVFVSFLFDSIKYYLPLIHIKTNKTYTYKTNIEIDNYSSPLKGAHFF